MPLTSKYVFVVSMDVDADKEALFNEVYDTEHVPLICKVPGVRAASRIKGEDFVDIILNQPACSRFITRKLYHYFVSDVPPDERGGDKELDPAQRAVLRPTG